MSKCNGEKQECKDGENHHYTGDGIFVCYYYDSQAGECELEPFKKVRKK